MDFGECTSLIYKVSIILNCGANGPSPLPGLKTYQKSPIPKLENPSILRKTKNKTNKQTKKPPVLTLEVFTLENSSPKRPYISPSLAQFPAASS